LHEVVHGQDLLLERRRRREELEEVMAVLSGDLGRRRAEEQGVVDVVDFHVDVVRLAPLFDVRVVEPLVVVGDEVDPLQDPEVTRELLAREPERPVEPERLVAQGPEHSDRERGRGAPLQ
jgi:hypothetical protein